MRSEAKDAEFFAHGHDRPVIREMCFLGWGGGDGQDEKEDKRQFPDGAICSRVKMG